jgi:hypothetical protein
MLASAARAVHDPITRTGGTGLALLPTEVQ